MTSINTEPLTTLSNAGIYRSNRWLVRGIDMVVEPGEIVTLIGPNGSGKTTTAKLALGILKPDEGTVFQNKKIKVGYVPQAFNVDWTLPLNVSRFMRLTNRISQKQANDALAMTEVIHLRDSELHALSGGELRRVLIARAIAFKPSLIVLDEPVQGIDFNGGIAIYELIKEIRNELKPGILLISHDLHVVMAATDRIICLNGHICCSGTPSMVASNSAYQKLFGANATSTLAVYEHSHDHTHLADGRVRHADGSVTDHCHPDDGHHEEQYFKENDLYSSTIKHEPQNDG
ncbi:MAG: zinc ABC transporter ATP-binding protein [Magnetovibrio sp.]|nr:zinc ABC transporter ATP-binding protein [Magnetovibrio sp.]